MTKNQLIGLGIVALAAVNIAAFAFIGFWALFVAGGSGILVDQIVNLLKEDKKETQDGKAN